MLISPGRIGRIGQPTGPKGRVSRLQSLLTALFGNGEQGAFYVPKPQVLGQQVLYQDATGTTPVTSDGDSVGRMLDLSGNDNHATQEVSGSRPVYRTNGTRHWLEFDGADDFMEEGNFVISNGTIGSGWMMTLAAAVENTGSFSLAGSSAGSDLRMYLSSTSGESDRIQGGSGSSFASAANGQPDPRDGQSRVYGIVDDGAAFARRVNGTSYGGGSRTFGDGEHTGFRIGEVVELSRGNLQGRIYGLVLRAALTDAPLLSQVETYLANLAGVTLDD